MSNSGFHVCMPTQGNDSRPSASLRGPALLDRVAPGPVILYHGKVLPHPSGPSTLSSPGLCQQRGPVYSAWLQIGPLLYFQCGLVSALCGLRFYHSQCGSPF